MKSLLAILLVFTCAAGVAQTINGAIFDGRMKKDVPFATVELLDASMKRKSITPTAMDGHFSFKTIAPGDYSIRISSVGYRDTLFRNITITSDTTLKLDISRYCQYDASKKNKTCPKCRKKDQVIPIVYGLPVSLDGKHPMDEHEKTVYWAGCEIITDCKPNWYCKRDKTEF